MLKEERQAAILDTLRRERKLIASELCLRLSVSEDTIRRDLKELEDAGKLLRVHGGALPRSPASVSFDARREQAVPAKAAIARAALQLIRPRQVVLFDGGTTTLQIAGLLPADLRATVITNSPPVAVALSDHPGVEVIMLGGRVYKESRVVTGAETVEAIRALRVDLCLLGICSLHPEAGISTPDYEEMHVKRAMIAASAETAALVSPEKLDTISTYSIAPLHELTHLITDAAVADEILQPYREKGIAVLKAG